MDFPGLLVCHSRDLIEMHCGKNDSVAICLRSNHNLTVLITTFESGSHIGFMQSRIRMMYANLKLFVNLTDSYIINL